jgi:hypothetical protein
MCDYSLHHIASTPAKVGDKLVTSPFYGTDTRGFTAEDNEDIAVCLLPGTELAFESDVLYGRGLLPRRRVSTRVARFNQRNMHEPYVHHDALEFPDGQVVMVNDLCPGQKATVLQLPAMPHEEKQQETETSAETSAAIGPAPAEADRERQPV